jgi:hypothetical protein
LIKTVKIEDNVFNLAATGGMVIIYKQQFGKEYYEELETLSTASQQSTKEALYGAYKLIWAMSKAADVTVPDPDIWINSFDKFPLLQLIPHAVDLLTRSFGQIKKEDGEKDGSEKMTAENLVACCLACGMNISDINNLSIGFLINSVSEYVKIKSGAASQKGRVHTRKATQADFDAF